MRIGQSVKSVDMRDDAANENTAEDVDAFRLLLSARYPLDIFLI